MASQSLIPNDAIKKARHLCGALVDGSTSCKVHHAVPSNNQLISTRTRPSDGSGLVHEFQSIFVLISKGVFIKAKWIFTHVFHFDFIDVDPAVLASLHPNWLFVGFHSICIMHGSKQQSTAKHLCRMAHSSKCNNTIRS